MQTGEAQTVDVFAYGSNMLTRRLQERCPSAQPLGVAELRGYRLCWHKRSRDGSGKCDVVAASGGDSVFGVLFSVAATEKPALDRAEGLGNGYAEKVAEVLCRGQGRRALLYYAKNIDHDLIPYNWYQKLVVAGAEEHGLPAHYLETIRNMETANDPNRARHNKNMALLESIS